MVNAAGDVTVSGMLENWTHLVDEVTLNSGVDEVGDEFLLEVLYSAKTDGGVGVSCPASERSWSDPADEANLEEELLCSDLECFGSSSLEVLCEIERGGCIRLGWIQRSSLFTYLLDQHRPLWERNCRWRVEENKFAER